MNQTHTPTVGYWCAPEAEFIWLLGPYPDRASAIAEGQAVFGRTFFTACGPDRASLAEVQRHELEAPGGGAVAHPNPEELWVDLGNPVA